MSTRAPAAGLEEYQPRYPLWSDGASKERLVYVPPEAFVTENEDGHVEFPVGTVLAKTFTHEDVDGRSGPIPIETRLLYRTDHDWSYAVYRWDRSGREAIRLEGDWRALPLEIPGPDGEPFVYTIPSRLDCKTCHATFGSFAGQPVLGLSRFQWDPELDLPTVGVQAPEQIVGAPEEIAAFGYAVGNCVSCHHGGRGDNASFSLYPADFVENTVNVEVDTDVAEVGWRVTPGAPDTSVLYRTVLQAEDVEPMPPLAVTQGDPLGAAILRRWIESL